MPEAPQCLELGTKFISYNKTLKIIKIWNYNKSIIESVKGIKEIELILNGKII